MVIDVGAEIVAVEHKTAIDVVAVVCYGLRLGKITVKLVS
jgi:hypothetical protein